MKNEKKTTYEEPCLDVTDELDDVLTTSGENKPFGGADSDAFGWT